MDTVSSLPSRGLVSAVAIYRQENNQSPVLPCECLWGALIFVENVGHQGKRSNTKLTLLFIYDKIF